MVAVFMWDEAYKTHKYVSLSTDFNGFICYLLRRESAQIQAKMEEQAEFIRDKESLLELQRSVHFPEEENKEADCKSYTERRFKKNDRPWLVFGRVVTIE